jgi:proline iminopeptidase
MDSCNLLEGIPGALVHGRFDVSSPLETAWQLHRHWPGSTLHVVEDGGHGTGDSFPSALIGALNDVANRSA